jgi:hypothetical protein
MALPIEIFMMLLNSHVGSKDSWVWAGGTFFPVVQLCQFFWLWQEIVFGGTYVLRVQYSCGVVSVFLGGKTHCAFDCST